jgi:peptide-methionine (S)-S-oxide reductase
MAGVVRTRVGYAGGTTANPTYRNIGDHTETLQLDYDPDVLSYEDLLTVFWASHNPTYRVYSTQYKAAIFTHNAEQRRLALATRDAEAARRGVAIHTEILPYTGFTRAEDYHQKYRLRNTRELIAPFRAAYPDLGRGFTDSTAAARVNGFVSGYGEASTLRAEIDRYGLPPEARQALLSRAGV